MLELVNADRLAAGVLPVAWDTQACAIGRMHAEDMAASEYFSHWDRQGYGPDIRYALAGGQHAIMENIYMWQSRYSGGGPGPIGTWAERLREAEASLMQSPGHRANILDSAHTHLGVGMAYSPATGTFYLSQEFTNQYLILDALPATAHLRDQVTLRGTLLPGAMQPLLNIAFEPFPGPCTREVLNSVYAGAYRSPAEPDRAIALHGRSGEFTGSVILDHAGQEGLYHLYIWVEARGSRVLGNDVVVKVRR